MKKAVFIFTISFIIFSTIITGNPIAKNDQTINILAGLVGIIFCIYIIAKQKNIVITKQNIAVLILCISSTIPLIFNSYVSLSGTIYYIFRYISIFIIYIVVSYFINDNKINKEYIKNTLIFSAIILVLFGIDLMTTDISYDLVKRIIGTKPSREWETRMYSLFFYSNTFAISASVGYILTLGEILKEKLKITYIGFLSLFLSAILLTQSRICIILLAIALISYFIFINTKNKYKFIKVIFINVIFSLIYVVLFNYLRQAGNGILIWFTTFLMILASDFLGKVLIKNEKVNKLINAKIFVILITVSILIFLLLAHFKSPLVLFNGQDAQSKITREIMNVEQNQNYEIKLEIEAISNTEEDNYKIAFIQQNKYSDEITREEISVNNCKEEICIKITTDENVNLILFSITANKTNENTKLIVKSLKLNDEEFILNYRFLPTDIINKLKYMDLSQKSVWERVTFIKDGLNIVSQNPLLGIGGDGWKYKQFEIQEYSYNASQMHCYLLQVFMEFGTVGVIALSIIIISTLKNIWRLIKEKEDVDLSIAIAFIVLFAHSLLDFDMTFLYIMFIFYILISMLNNKKQQGISNNMLTTISLIIIVIAGSISIYFNCAEMYVEITKDDSLEKVRTYEEKTALENLYISLVPYNDKYIIERIKYLELYLDVKDEELEEKEKTDMEKEEIELLIQSIEAEKGSLDMIDKCISILKIADSEKDKQYAYKKIEEIFSKHRYDANKIYKDYTKLYCLIYGNNYIYMIDYLHDENLLYNLEKNNAYDTDRLLKIVHDNIEKDIKFLREYEKCRITKEESEEIIEKIQIVQ